VILKPSFGIATGQAYADLDAIPAARRTCAAATLAGVVRSVTRGDLETLRTHNDFGQPAEVRHPRIAALRSGLVHAGAQSAFLTGSGSAVVGLFSRQRDAARARRTLAARFPVTAHTVPLRMFRLRPATP